MTRPTPVFEAVQGARSLPMGARISIIIGWQAQQFSASEPAVGMVMHLAPPLCST